MDKTKKIIVAEIKKILPHPQAHKLKICLVFDGQEEVQVICGATNARAGMKTILAPVGSTTPQNLTIQVAEMRGESSHGMLCSAKDLGVTQETGIIDLPDHFAVGTPYTEIPLQFMSSTPWYQYPLVDSFWFDPHTKKVVITRNNHDEMKTTQHEKFILLSQTYFHQGHYKYRHFPYRENKSSSKSSN